LGVKFVGRSAVELYPNEDIQNALACGPLSAACLDNILDHARSWGGDYEEFEARVVGGLSIDESDILGAIKADDARTGGGDEQSIGANTKEILTPAVTPTDGNLPQHWDAAGHNDSSIWIQIET
jgi:hypothetical protein